MGKLIVEAEVSVDSAMGAAHMDFWQQVFQFHSQDVRYYINDLLFVPGALVMGKDTYEAFAAVWPTREGKDADQINSMPKYVASRTLKEPLTWNAKLINGDVVEAVRTLKQAPGKGLLQYGVGELTRTLLKAGLVDELRLLVYPFTFGQGPQLVEHIGANTLELLEIKQFQSGVVALHYHPTPK
jgi:dihydrofolate reductase